MNDIDFQTCRNMEKFGGSFVVKLAGLYRSADLTNKRILKDAFSEYFEKYHPNNWS